LQIGIAASRHPVILEEEKEESIAIDGSPGDTPMDVDTAEPAPKKQTRLRVQP
jgi:hypothetical protein